MIFKEKGASTIYFKTKKQKKVFDITHSHRNEMMALDAWLDLINRSLSRKIDNTKELSHIFAYLKKNGVQIQKQIRYINEGNVHKQNVCYMIEG